MNEQEYMNITSKIDGKYVDEYRICTAKHTISLRKKIRTCLLVAAAAAVMIPVGVIAYKKITHRDKLKVYFSEKGVQRIEESMLVDGYTVENGKIRLTVDVQMCDGNYIYGVYTLTALTEDAKSHLISRESKQVYTDTGEWIYPGGGGSQSATGDAISEDEISFAFTYDAHNAYLDESRPRRMIFFEYVETGESDGYGHVVVEDYTYYEGLYFDLLTKPNVPTKTVRSADGEELTLSPYGVSRMDENWSGPANEGFTSIDSIVVLGTDGDRLNIMTCQSNGRVTTDLEDVNVGYSGDIGSGEFSLEFGVFLDLDNFNGVEINGVTYMEV